MTESRGDWRIHLVEYRTSTLVLNMDVHPGPFDFFALSMFEPEEPYRSAEGRETDFCFIIKMFFHPTAQILGKADI